MSQKVSVFKSLIIEMLVNKQMLEAGRVEEDKIKFLQKHQEDLKKEFTKEFRTSNVKEIKKFNELIGK